MEDSILPARQLWIPKKSNNLLQSVRYAAPMAIPGNISTNVAGNLMEETVAWEFEAMR